MSQLRTDTLKKRYKSRVVVKDVSLEVSSGEVVGLLGPNGAGKTTCFYMIVGLVAVDGGRIFVDGRVRVVIMPKKKDGGTIPTGAPAAPLELKPAPAIADPLQD